MMRLYAVRIAEGGSATSNLKFQDLLKDIIAFGVKPMSAGSVRIDASGFKPKPGLGHMVDDPKAEKGKSIALSPNHYEWSATFPLRSVAYDSEVDYLVRVRLRADMKAHAPANSEVLWSGIWDSLQKCGLGDLALKAKDVKDGWAWYDVCTLRLNDSAYLWIAPGRFDRGKYAASPSHNGVWVDCIEIVRK